MRVTAPSTEHRGRITTTRRGPSKRVWLSAIATVTVVAFIGVFIANGGVLNNNSGSGSSKTTTPTLVTRPVLPADGTATTAPGSSARCKDGTYAFKGGTGQGSSNDLCKDNGGVEQMLN